MRNVSAICFFCDEPICLVNFVYLVFLSIQLNSLNLNINLNLYSNFDF